MLDAFPGHPRTARHSTFDGVERERDGPIADGVERQRDATRPRGRKVRTEPLGGDAHDAKVPPGEKRAAVPEPSAPSV